jgi:hypothetical protein
MDKSEIILTIDNVGTKRWKNEKEELHRLDGPAIEWRSGSKEWYQNNKLHRLDGPAYTTNSGYKEGRFRGSIHREDGPAILYDDGCGKRWFLNDIQYRTKEEYFDALSDEAKSKCLFSKDFLNE